MTSPNLYVVGTETAPKEADVPTRIDDMDLVLLEELIDYDPVGGSVRWRRNHHIYTAGQEAGYIRKDGTHVIWFGDKERAAAPLCWALYHGAYPGGRVRLKDRQQGLRIENLYVPAGNWKSRENRREYEKARRTEKPHLFRNNDLMKNFGITSAQYAEMLDAQDGVCAVCSRPETAIRKGKVKMLSVDHNHTTNAIRALLCADCNIGIGHFRESPERLRAAADYLESHAGKVVPIRKENTA